MILAKFVTKGGSLSKDEVDNNWTLIENFLNAVTNSNHASAKSMTVTLVPGDNTVNHSLGKKARFATFFLANGQATEYAWVRDPADPTNKIIVSVPDETPERELTDTEVNIQAL